MRTVRQCEKRTCDNHLRLMSQNGEPEFMTCEVSYSWEPTNLRQKTMVRRPVGHGCGNVLHDIPTSGGEFPLLSVMDDRSVVALATVAHGLGMDVS